MKKSITCFTLGETVSAKSVSAKVKRSPLWHGRMPAAILLDPALSSDAVKLYGILALKTFQGNISSIGLRQLGKLAGMSPATAMRRLRELISTGHLKISKAGNGQRAWYELTSPVFAQKQRAGVETIVQYPRRRLVSVRATA